MIKRILITGLTALLILLLGTIILLSTPAGLQLSISVAQRFNHHLHIDGATGNLLGKVHVNQIRYATKHQHIIVEQVSLNWRPLYLLAWQLRVKQLSIKAIHYYALQPSSSSSSKPLSLSSLPSLRIKQVYLADVDIYNSKTQQEQQLKAIKLHAILTKQKLRLQAQAQLIQPYAITLHADAKGTPNNYTFASNIKSELITTQIKGHGKQHGLSADIKSQSSHGGTLTGPLTLSWSPSFAISSNLIAKKLQFKDYWVTGPVKLTMSDTDHFDIDTNLNTSLGKLAIKGHHRSNWQLQWNVNLRRLDKISPYLQGSITGKGSIHGDFKQPNIAGTLAATGLSYTDLHLNTLRSNWNVNLNPSKPSFFRININKFEAPGLSLDQINTAMTGSLNQHAISLNAKNSNGAIQVHANGTYQPLTNHWQGNINKMNLLSQGLANWQLKKSFKVLLTANHQHIHPFCWYSPHAGKICGQFEHKKTWQTQLTSTLHLSALPVLHLYGSKLSGSVITSAHLAGSGSKLDAAKLTIHTHKLQALFNSTAKHKAVTFTKATLSAQLNNKQLQFDHQFSTTDGDQGHIQLNAEPVRRIGSDINPKINGSVTLNIHRLQNFKYGIPDDFQASGSAKLDATITGRLQSPNIKLSLDASKASAQLVDLGLTLSHAKIIANTINNTLALSAKVYSNKQPVNIQSTLRLKNMQPEGQATITGKSIPVIDTLDYRAQASPNVTIKIKNQTVSISGEVKIPQATIAPKKFSSTVTLPTNDIVFINQEATPPSQWQNAMSLKIILGDNIKLDTHGVTGNLQGELTLLNKPGQAIMGSGKVLLKDGKFDSHGHKLSLSQAAVIYRNSPLENPGLDVTASRTINTFSSSGVVMLGIDSLTVGAHVTGHANHPKIALFSTPVSLNDTEILSYLLLGHAAGGTSAADLTLLANAFSSGSGGIGSMMNDFEQGLGLTEFGIQSETALDISGNPIESQNAFVVGKYITPKIYLRYSRGLVDQNNTILLRYMITPKWAIQTSQSNLGTGGDIIYTFYRH